MKNVKFGKISENEEKNRKELAAFKRKLNVNSEIKWYFMPSSFFIKRHRRPYVYLYYAAYMVQTPMFLITCMNICISLEKDQHFVGEYVNKKCIEFSMRFSHSNGY